MSLVHKPRMKVSPKSGWLAPDGTIYPPAACFAPSLAEVFQGKGWTKLQDEGWLYIDSAGWVHHGEWPSPSVGQLQTLKTLQENHADSTKYSTALGESTIHLLDTWEKQREEINHG